MYLSGAGSAKLDFSIAEAGCVVHRQAGADVSAGIKEMDCAVADVALVNSASKTDAFNRFNLRPYEWVVTTSAHNSAPFRHRFRLVSKRDGCGLSRIGRLQIRPRWRAPCRMV